MKKNSTYEDQLSKQVELRKKTVELIKLISDLWYDNNIELVLFRNQLVDRNVSEILNLLDYSREFVQKRISMAKMIKIAQKIQAMEIAPAKIDLGKLTYVYQLTREVDLDEFVMKKLKDAKNGNTFSPKDVVLYGFGRIGRLLARELMSRTGKGVQMRLRAIVLRGNITREILEKRASCFKKILCMVTLKVPLKLISIIRR